MTGRLAGKAAGLSIFDGKVPPILGVMALLCLTDSGARTGGGECGIFHVFVTAFAGGFQGLLSLIDGASAARQVRIPANVTADSGLS